MKPKYIFSDETELKHKEHDLDEPDLLIEREDTLNIGDSSPLANRSSF